MAPGFKKELTPVREGGARGEEVRVRSWEQEAQGDETERVCCWRTTEYKCYQTPGGRSCGEDKEGVWRRPWGKSPGSCNCCTAVTRGTIDSCNPQGPGPGFPPNLPTPDQTQEELIQTVGKIIEELQSEIHTAQLELGKKENSTKFFKAENQAMHKCLQTLSDANTREKLLLVEDVTKLKKLAEIVIQDISHKEAELLEVQQELQRATNSMKEKEHNRHHLENELHQQIQHHQDMEAKLVENRSECVRVQALLHQLEEKYLTSSQSMQQHIAKELSEEAEKLRQQLKEKELSADEDKYLRNKMAEDCGYLTKENGFLQSQVLEATRQLDRERQLREEESTCHTRRISELACEKEKERQLEMELTYLKRLLQDERQKALTAQEQVRRLQQERKSVNLNGQSLQSQLKDLERRWSRAQLENSKLQTEKTHLVEHISQLHKQISEKEDEISRMLGHVNTMSYDLTTQKSQVETEHSLQRERWKEFSNILTAYKSPAK